MYPSTRHDCTQVCEFSTVEEFWKYWSFIPRPSEILYDGNTRKEIEGRTIDAYSVFKKGTLAITQPLVVLSTALPKS